jgi:hypothetical protein
MADEKEKRPDVVQVKPKEGKVKLNERVKVECTDKAPHHQKGEITMCSKHVAAKMEKNGWGKIVTAIALFIMFAFGANAQQSYSNKMQNAGIDSVGVTNTGTAYVTTTVATVNLAYTTVVVARVWSVSGTNGGTITLQGSIDGVGYSTVHTAGYALTATATVSGANTAATYYSFVIGNSPYKYYRLSYTGSGTMVSYLKGSVWSH